MTDAPTPRQWSLILGASGGLGGACARSLARRGHGILGVHLDTAERADQIDDFTEELRGLSGAARFWNCNAANEAAMKEAIPEMAALCKESGGVRVLVHSLAFGSLAPFIRERPGQEIINPRQMQMTLNIMAHSLVYWVQALMEAELLRAGAKVFALTSIGTTHVLVNYGAVSAAKSALESHVRQLAVELAPHHIAVNAIRAGITRTPAMLRIPGSEELLERARHYNPHKRLTTPEDVGETIALLSSTESPWMTGNIINADGGELLTI